MHDARDKTGQTEYDTDNKMIFFIKERWESFPQPPVEVSTFWPGTHWKSEMTKWGAP